MSKISSGTVFLNHLHLFEILFCLDGSRLSTIRKSQNTEKLKQPLAILEFISIVYLRGVATLT